MLRALAPLIVLSVTSCREPAAAKAEAPIDAASTEPTAAAPECNADSQCMVIASCDCGRCVASRKGKAEVCSEPCKANPCVAHLATCDHGRCIEHIAVACEKDADCTTPPCGPCTEGTVVTKDMLTQTCVLNPCPKAGVLCQNHVCTLR